MPLPQRATPLLLLLLLAPTLAARSPAPSPGAMLQAIEAPPMMAQPARLLAEPSSATSPTLLKQLEQLLQNSAHQERAFTHSWLRYMTLTEQQGDQQRAARFLQRLSERHPTAWARGAALVSQTMAQSTRLSTAFSDRMHAITDQPLLAVNLQALYELALPRQQPDSRQGKEELITALGTAWGPGFDTSGMTAITLWHDRPTELAPPEVNAVPVQQALQQGSPARLVEAVAHYYQQLIASNTLSHGMAWIEDWQARQPDNGALPLIHDLLHTTRQNQQRYQQALRQLQRLRQDQPASLALALGESLLQFHNPVGSRWQARQSLQSFRQNQHPGPAEAQLLNQFDQLLLGT